MKRRQLSMVLPEALIGAIKQRASERGLSITAYITTLVQHDLATRTPPQATAADIPPSLPERMQALEERMTQLEQQIL